MKMVGVFVCDTYVINVLRLVLQCRIYAGVGHNPRFVFFNDEATMPKFRDTHVPIIARKGQRKTPREPSAEHDILR